MAEPVLSVRNLNVRFRTGDGILHAVKGIDLDINAGETVAIVGESGSGKSQTMMSVMGLLASNGWAEGSVKYRGEELVGLSPGRLNHYRGSKLTMIFQEPMTSLDPLYRIGDQLSLPLTTHGGMSKADARKRAIELLELVRIPDPARRIDAYPHELSGGQRQRVMIAMALANNPDVLIADEPTTALDVTVQARILDLLADLQKRLGMSIVFITHDLGVVRRFAERTYVMRRGEVVESGRTADIFAAPKHPYTQMLIDAEPTGRKEPVAASAPVVLDAQNMSVQFTLEKSFFGKTTHVLRAVDNVSLRVRTGETIGVVGESGSGKSTLGRAILRLQPASGLVRFEDRNLMPLDRRGMQPLRRHLQLVFQDPFGSLSPRMTAGEIVTEGLLVHEPSISRKERDRRAAQAFDEVQLDPAWRNRFPHEFSGGQRQRIAIARAMILHPKLVVLDEPTSALDRSVQKEIVELLRNLQKAHGLAYVFISHDLAVVRALSDEIMVMKSGKVVERGTAGEIFDRPREEYTRDLIAAAFLTGRGTVETAVQPLAS
ncbi:ABC transporter ATP-binding protein [Microvirga sp. BT689]|uniref:ABC transporter ATP-binding protein n=1 Tax=Microvirga arvi TaxID=2778731 RepID=UPI0019512F9F|nr:ABC transporter ATP-binding protein [Microvirga arvi]MBM6580472.1 ABC transporter ATP-binding protein [Microvirga arvi]